MPAKIPDGCACDGRRADDGGAPAGQMAKGRWTPTTDVPPPTACLCEGYHRRGGAFRVANLGSSPTA